MVILILAYLVACALVATLGTQRRFLGFWGYFFMSIVVTPILVVLILLITQPLTKLVGPSKTLES